MNPVKSRAVRAIAATVASTRWMRVDGRRRRECRAYPNAPPRVGRWLAGSACAPDELALLGPSDWWLTGMLLAFPMPMREGSGYAREVGCLA